MEPVGRGRGAAQVGGPEVVVREDHPQLVRAVDDLDVGLRFERLAGGGGRDHPGPAPRVVEDFDPGGEVLDESVVGGGLALVEHPPSRGHRELGEGARLQAVGAGDGQRVNERETPSVEGRAISPMRIGRGVLSTRRWRPT